MSEQSELAARLVEADDAGRARLLRTHAALADARLAHALKDICYGVWSTEPARAVETSRALDALASFNEDPEIAAVAAWAAGIAAIVEGELERAIARLDDAGSRFNSLGMTHAAASTEVSRLYALALLGRYDEATEAGLSAREVFLAHGDTLMAGKVEQNIGNLHIRRGRYQEAEQFQLAARERFLAVGDQLQLAKVDNCLALLRSLQHDFRSAERLYESALRHAEAAGFTVTQAEIEASMGNLALFQGRYDRALDYLERSRRRYAALGMAHQSAVAELELADAYLELNLAPEAASTYERAAPTFDALGMRAEQARALANLGRALIALGRADEAHRRLSAARSLYAAEGNRVGEASVGVTEAQLLHAEGDFRGAGEAAAAAEPPLAEAGAWGRLLLARWLRGEAARAGGDAALAETLLDSALGDAETQALPQIAERCHTSLGLVAASRGDMAQAEESFLRAVTLVETMRAPLPAEELRTAFVADKLAPYDELARLCLDDPSGRRTVEALRYVERARSRALLELMGGAREARPRARDAFEAERLARLDELREELNWFYSKINRPPEGEGGRASASTVRALHEEVRSRERETLEIMRQLRLRSGDEAGSALSVGPGETAPLDFERLTNALGDRTALVEYTTLGGRLLAFVVTRGRVEVVRDLGSEEQLGAALAGVRFQMDALRYGARGLRAHLPSLAGRTRRHLAALYDLLLRPLENLTEGARRLVVVPHRALHYVPFQALHDGAAYVVERREVSYAPSAGVLLHCLAKPRPRFERALLLGVADAQTPRVRDEIEALAPLFPEATALLDSRATLDSLREGAPRADVLHLACHGQFRPDNPLFSSLRLGDGWMTVRDAYALEIAGGLVTLSACETGVSAVAPGDELLGLARGFFSAGARTLLMSLWTVDDEATAETMSHFYARLVAGDSPAAALRQAQLSMLEARPHPFFWSPFVLVGAW